MDEALRDELMALIVEDERVRARLAADGSLFSGYNLEMAATHRRNAAVLKTIIAAHGWPGMGLVGEEAEEAAFRVLQHSIGEPEFQRRGLLLLQAAVEQGEAPALQLAMLFDRVRRFEGRPQLYGTQFDWDENGEMSPGPIEDAETVDERRLPLGLRPLAEAVASMREAVAASNEKPPADWAQRRRDYDAWALSVGWREEEPLP